MEAEVWPAAVHALWLDTGKLSRHPPAGEHLIKYKGHSMSAYQRCTGKLQQSGNQDQWQSVHVLYTKSMHKSVGSMLWPS